MKKLRSIVARFSADDLLRHAGILFSGMMVVHVCNMVFQMAIIRRLPAEEYALLMAFLAVLAIFSRPLSSLTTSMSHFSSLMRQEGRAGDVKRLLRKWLLLMGGAGLGLGLLALLFNRFFSEVFHLDRVAPVLVAGAVLPALFCAPVLNGAAQGLQFFKWGMVAGILGAVMRLALGAGFVWFVVPACGWAMLGHGLGAYVSAGVLFFCLLWMLRGEKKTGDPLPRMRFYLLQSFFVQAAYAVLMTADVVFVKHYVPEDSEFAYAATLGRMVVFLAGPIVTAMFPKVASKGSGSRGQYEIFLRSLALTALFVAVAVLGCILFSGVLIRIFGVADASVSLKRMIGLVALVMGFSALLNVMVQFLLAQRRFKVTLVVLGAALLYGMGVFFFHSTTLQIVWVSGVANVLAFFATFGVVCFGGKSVLSSCDKNG